MAIAAATIWEVRTAGADTNGGGFVAGAAGTDYSQQDSANSGGADSSTTDAVGDGTTTLTSATAAFGTTVVGNIIYLAGGTGSLTATRRQVTARASALSITVDAAVAAGTGITMNIGGALLSPAIAAAFKTDGNKVYVKAGTYTIASTSSNVATGIISDTLAGLWEGYQTTRGDLGTAPVFQVAAAGVTSVTVFTASSQACVVRNLTIDGQNKTSIRGMVPDGLVFKVLVQNCTNRGFNTAMGILVACRVTGCGGFGMVALGLFFCEAYDNTSTGINFSGVCVGCVSSGNTGGSSLGFQIPGPVSSMLNCVAYGNGSHGVRVDTAAHGVSLVNVLSEGNGGYGFSGLGAVRPATQLFHCGGYNNTSGNVDAAAFSGSLNMNFITGSASFFTNPGSGDFSLNTTAGGGAAARAVGYPATFPRGLTSSYRDIGAAQHADPAGGGGLLRHPGLSGGLSA